MEEIEEKWLCIADKTKDWLVDDNALFVEEVKEDVRSDCERKKCMWYFFHWWDKDVQCEEMNIFKKYLINNRRTDLNKCFTFSYQGQTFFFGPELQLAFYYARYCCLQVAPYDVYVYEGDTEYVPERLKKYFSECILKIVFDLYYKTDT